MHRAGGQAQVRTAGDTVFLALSGDRWVWRPPAASPGRPALRLRGGVVRTPRLLFVATLVLVAAGLVAAFVVAAAHR